MGEAKFPAALVDVLEESFLAVLGSLDYFTIVFVAGIVQPAKFPGVEFPIVLLPRHPPKVRQPIICLLVVLVVDLLVAIGIRQERLCNQPVNCGALLLAIF